MISIPINGNVIFTYSMVFVYQKDLKSLWSHGVFHSDQLEPHLGTGLSSAAAEELGRRGISDGFFVFFPRFVMGAHQITGDFYGHSFCWTGFF